MPKLLQPKVRSRNIDQLNRRLAANANGWSLIPSEGKAYVPKAWPTMRNDAVAIHEWDDPKGGHRNFAGTGARVEGNMLVLDLDISDQAILSEILNRLAARWPAAFRGGLVRTSGAVSQAIFLQVDEPVGMRRTARYGAVSAAQAVEVFGSKVVRYFAIDGPHATKGRVYEWRPGLAPWNVRLDSLPIFKAAELGELIDICDAVLGQHLDRIPGSDKAESTASTAWDLEPDGIFVATEGVELSNVELEQSLTADTERRGLMSWPDWQASHRKDHCKAMLDRSGSLVVMDFQAGVLHRWAADKPEIFELDPDTMAEIEALAGPGAAASAFEAAPGQDDPPPAPIEPATPLPGGNLHQAIVWMLRSFVMTEPGQVVRLYATAAPYAQSLTAFNDVYAPYSEMRGRARVYASKIWKVHPARQTVATWDMRPDMGFPTFVDAGKLFKNTYVAPRHEGEGEVETFLQFARHLVPDDLEYFLDWNAHKVQFPAVPGHALILVAADDEGGERSGTGRGTFFKIMERLHGRRYVKHLDFSILTGQSAQGVYTDWMADSLLVLVDESREGTGRFGERRSAYEHLKVRCDTSARWMTVHGKNLPPRDSYIVCSFIIATNHADALMIPPSDRRFAVLANGEKLSQADADRVYAWMDQPGNIAALARWLRRRDVSKLDMVGPPPNTEARKRMMQLGESDIDGLVREALVAMPGLVFTGQQLLLHLHNLGADPDAIRGAGVLGQILRRRAVPLSIPGTLPPAVRRFLVAGNQVRGYVRNWTDAKACDAMSADEIRVEIAKNGLRSVGEEIAEALRDTTENDDEKR